MLSAWNAHNLSSQQNNNFWNQIGSGVVLILKQSTSPNSHRERVQCRKRRISNEKVNHFSHSRLFCLFFPNRLCDTL